MDKLPKNLDAERYVLGAAFHDETVFEMLSANLCADDFTLEKNRLLFTRMGDLHELGEKIDRVTLANNLDVHRELDKVGGISGIISLDDEIPNIINPDSYVRILKEKSALRKIAAAASKVMNRAMVEDGQAVEIARSGSKILDDIIISNEQQKSFFTPMEVLEGAEGGVQGFMEPKRDVGLTTGFDRLDSLTNGLQRGRVYIIAAYTSTGKSAFCLNIASGVVSEGFPVLYITMEITKEELMARWICSNARISLSKFKKSLLSKDEREIISSSTSRLVKQPMYFDDCTSLTLSELEAKILRAISRFGVKLVVIDYLQIMNWQGDKEYRFKDEYTGISTYSRFICNYAKRMKIPIILISQLSRPEGRSKPGGRRPNLHQLRGSGRISEDARFVGLLYRAERDGDTSEEKKGTAELIVEKNTGGPVGTIQLRFEGRHTRFWEDPMQPDIIED